MKKITVYLVLLLTAWGWISCSKDKGNYIYHDINELSFQDIDTARGYSVYYGDTLHITPTLVGTLDPAATQHTYKYEWSFGYELKLDSVISTERNLHVQINLPPGNYTLQYKVTDNTTGVLFHIRIKLVVTTEIYEGYMVLNEVNNASRLDMISYRAAEQTFVQYTDVLRKMESALPPQGKPYQVFCMDNAMTGGTDPSTFGIYLLTASGTNRVQPETFAYDPTNNIRYEMIGEVPQDFKAERLIGELQSGYFPQNYMYADGNVYGRSFFSGAIFIYTPLNVYQSGATAFKASPWMVTDGYSVVMFNTEKRTFASTATSNSVNVNDVLPAFNYPTGKDLVYMTRIATNENVYAILKDPGTGKYYMSRFIIGATSDYFAEITGTDIDKATSFAVSPELGYLFYSVGGKVYEYDLSLNSSKLMLDKGASQISYLAFQNFFYRDAKPATYGEWGKLLTVGIYDLAGTAGANGTLEQYAVPPVNAQITQVNKWTGFGKIVSVSYRERAQ